MRDIAATRDFPIVDVRDRCACCRALLGWRALSQLVGRIIVKTCGSSYCARRVPEIARAS